MMNHTIDWYINKIKLTVTAAQQCKNAAMRYIWLTKAESLVASAINELKK